MNISIIIPTYNEAANIGALICHLAKYAAGKVAEIIVSDGGSADNTVQLAQAAGAFAVESPARGRAAQMNHGAALAKGDILYFVHADTFPPPTYVNDITEAVEGGYDLGRYKSKYLSAKPILRLNEWFTHFDLFICMGGDQTLFTRKTFFQQCNGFREDMQIMEEYEFCSRARKVGRYKIMNGVARISARKYEKNSWLQVQRANYKVVNMYKKGASQQSMVQQYKKMLKF